MDRRRIGVARVPTGLFILVEGRRGQHVAAAAVAADAVVGVGVLHAHVGYYGMRNWGANLP